MSFSVRPSGHVVAFSSYVPRFGNVKCAKLAGLWGQGVSLGVELLSDFRGPTRGGLVCLRLPRQNRCNALRSWIRLSVMQARRATRLRSRRQPCHGRQLNSLREAALRRLALPASGNKLRECKSHLPLEPGCAGLVGSSPGAYKAKLLRPWGCARFKSKVDG